MAKGDRQTLDFHGYQDPDTGAEVTRLTPLGISCHRNYFYQKCFTGDGSGLLFAGAFDGPLNYGLLNLKNGQMVQLTEGEGDNTFGGFLSPDDRCLYYVKRERNLMRVDLGTLEESRVYRVPEGWVGYGTWVANSSCTQLVGIEIREDDYRPLDSWQAFREFYHTQPRCRLIRVDLETGIATTVHEEAGWLGHPTYRPFDDSTLSFCHEGPHDLVRARIWFIDQNGDNRRKARVQESGESCTHEFWVPDGSAMIYVSYFKGTQERWICSVDPRTLEHRRLLRMPACSHLMSNRDGTLMVGDGADSPVDVADSAGYRIENDPYLYLFDVRNGRQQRIARHNSSWAVLDGNRQITHPHPSFTPDDRQVLFTSDFEGLPAVYLAAVPGR